MPKEAGSEDCSEKGFTGYMESFLRVLLATESNSQLVRDAEEEWARLCPSESPSMGQDKFKAAIGDFFLAVCPCLAALVWIRTARAGRPAIRQRHPQVLHHA